MEPGTIGYLKSQKPYSKRLRLDRMRQVFHEDPVDRGINRLFGNMREKMAASIEDYSANVEPTKAISSPGVDINVPVKTIKQTVQEFSARDPKAAKKFGESLALLQRAIDDKT